MSKTAITKTAAAKTGKVSAFAAAMTVAAKPDAAEGSDDGEDDERKKKDGESDEDYAKRMKALDDKEKPEAGADPAEPDAGEAADEEKKAAARAEGITAERTRWATVLKSEQAAGKGATACEMLASTDLPASNIITVLSTVTAPSISAPAHGLVARMAANKVDAPSPAAAAAGGGAQADENGRVTVTAQDIMSAAGAARGEQPRA